MFPMERNFFGFPRAFMAVYAVNRGLLLANIRHPAILLVVEIVGGGIAYVGAALLIARATARDLLQLLKKGLKKAE